MQLCDLTTQQDVERLRTFPLLGLEPLQLPPGGREGVAHRDIDVWICIALFGPLRLLAHGELGAGNDHVDMDLEQIAVAVLAMELLDRNPACDQPVVPLLEFDEALADICLDSGRTIEIVEYDLQG